MQTNFTGHNVTVTTDLKAYTEDKLTKLKRHCDRITSIHVVFDVEKLDHIVEASIMIGGDELHARSVSEDMYASIDFLVDKLNRQLIKHKEKKRHH